MNRYNPDIHKRKSIRLKNYDYSQQGAYFITLCCHQRQSIFGTIHNGVMQLNEWGLIAEREWLKTAQIRKNVELDTYIIMPNHIHGIIIIAEQHPSAIGQFTPATFASPSQTIGAIVRGYKGTVTKQINAMINRNNYIIWQRNYYEHIIRNEESYYFIAEYIKNNPITWQQDKLFTP